ncbi:MAG: hypothetical protein ABI388_11175 [Bacteroidia bacterium]
MKKTILTIACTAMAMTFSQSCSSTKSGTTSPLAAEVKSFAKQESEQLVVSYLQKKLAPSHPQLASLLASATSSTLMTSILGSNGANTGTLTSLISSQFGVAQPAVTSNVTSSGSTLGSVASFLVQNTNASTLSSLISAVK